MTSITIGLTGGIGSGKSAAADLFENLGVHCVDADLASRAVVEPGTSALTQIASHFGDEILLEDGALNRTALRHKVFADTHERKWLQTLLHPLINQWLREQLAQAKSSYRILVNPLLFETKQHKWCNRTLLIDVPEAVQLQRTMNRDGNTEQQVKNIMQAQMQRQQRLALADDVIVNDQDISHLQEQVTKLDAVYSTLNTKE